MANIYLVGNSFATLSILRKDILNGPMREGKV